MKKTNLIFSCVPGDRPQSANAGPRRRHRQFHMSGPNFVFHLESVNEGVVRVISKDHFIVTGNGTGDFLNIEALARHPSCDKKWLTRNKKYINSSRELNILSLIFLSYMS